MPLEGMNHDQNRGGCAADPLALVVRCLWFPVGREERDLGAAGVSAVRRIARSVVALVALVVAAAACLVACSDGDEPVSLPVTGTGVGAPGVSVTRTVSDVRAADRAMVVVFLEVPADEFDVAPSIDTDAVVTALEAAGFAADDIAVSATYESGVRVEVAVDPAALPQAGRDVVAVVEQASGVDALESGVVFGVGECPDLVADLRRRAVAEARDEAQLLADAAEIGLGPVIGVWDSASDPLGSPLIGGSRTGGGCPVGPDPSEAFDWFDVSDPSFSALQPFDASPEAVVSVSLTVTFAVGGMASDTGAPAAAISVTGRATVDGAADDGYVVAYVDASAVGSADDVARDLVDELADLDVLADDVKVELGYDAVVQVRLPADRVADDGPAVIDAIESLTSSAYDSGVWFTTDACPDILDEARAAAFRDAREQGASLAATSGVSLGAPVLVADSSFDYLSIPADRCHDLPADGAGDGYPIELEPLDASPRVAIEVWLDVSFAITG
jgi:uncharacterized protein YggE